MFVVKNCLKKMVVLNITNFRVISLMTHALRYMYLIIKIWQQQYTFSHQNNSGGVFAVVLHVKKIEIER